MTQPERPDRVDIPESNSSTSHEAVEPVDLGQRRRRRDFVPEKPSSVSPNVLTPADRSSARTIQEQIDAIAARQPYEEVEEDKSSEFLGEPTIPEEKKGFPIKRTIAGGLGTIALTAAGFLGLNKINSEDNGSERPGVIITDSTLEPATQPPMFTPEATPEPIITKEPEKSPYEFSWETNIGDTTIRIEDKLATRTECPDPTTSFKNATMVPCFGVSELVIDKENFPNVEEDMKETAIRAFYIAWKNKDESRKSVTLEEYKEKLNNNEDLSFTAWGFEGDSFLPSDIIISPKDKVYLDLLAQPSPIITPFNGLGNGYRKINDEIHLEVFSAGIGNPNQPDKNIATTGLYVQALSYLTNYETLKKGHISSTAEFQQFSDVMHEIVGNLTIKDRNGKYISPLDY